jgi:hypothetical protein
MRRHEIDLMSTGRVTFLSLVAGQPCTSACSPNTSLIALRSDLPPVDHEEDR